MTDEEREPFGTSENCRLASPRVEASPRLDVLLRSYVRSFVLAAAILVLFALSVVRTYSLGHNEKFYDNPIYRWRESLAIALSRMQNPPLQGYLADRSIRDYLARHGLALLAGEADVLPTPEQRRALVQDGARMNQLLQEAARVPIDPKLEPVTLTGNELGLADYFYWAFRIYGLNLNALVLFYYSILLVSVTLFFITFRRSPFCLLLLMFYLIGHFFAVNYANNPLIQTIHNSRFFATLSLLPAMHLLLLMIHRERASPTNVVVAGLQAFILFFVVFCRSQAFWQVLAILAGILVVLRFGDIWRALAHTKPRPAIKRIFGPTWPALVVICGLAGFAAYSSTAPDPRFYNSESRTHVFWHVLYVGLISTDPELTSLYGYGERTYSDMMGYVAVLHDSRGRNEAPSEFGEVVDGVININVIKDTGAYDRVVQRIYLSVVAEHPWLTLRSFFVGKPSDQMEMFTQVAALRNIRAYVEVLVLGLGASVLAVLSGTGLPQRRQIRESAIALALLTICSWTTTLIVPSVLIPDVIIFYLMLALLITTYLPLALVSSWLMGTTSPRGQTGT